MEATVSPRATGRGLIRRKADYIPPSRYTLRAAASDGDALTRLSFLILGAGNLARRQIVKGVFFLAVEVAYIAYMVVQGVGSLVTLGTLGYRTQTKHKVDGYWYYDAGDNSVLLLTAGVATVFITSCSRCSGRTRCAAPTRRRCCSARPAPRPRCWMTGTT